MDSTVDAISAARDAVCAVLRITRRREKRPSGKRKAGGTAASSSVTFGVGFVGTAWCIAEDRYLATAHHVLNNAKPREQDDRFYAFTVPGNGSPAYRFPVVGFPVEDPANDLAILELGPPAAAGQHVPALPVSLEHPPDGTRVLTYGFPAPAIKGANLDKDGNYLGGGQFFLKGHANEGIIAAQYEFSNAWQFEFNVGWHHGESGGPVIVTETGAAFAVMQHYRNITSPHGVVAGPHIGRALDVIRSELENCGATILT